MKIPFYIVLFTVALCGLASRAEAAVPARIALSVSTEDGTKMLVATVTLAGKPATNLKVSFFAHRTFGALTLGTDTTLDDGTAAVNFPASLPGDAKGELQLGAEIVGQPESRVLAVFPGGMPFHPTREEFPRALWSSRAPWLVLATVALLVALVWGAFAYVVFQLCGIRAAATVTAAVGETELSNQPSSNPEPETIT